MSILEIQKLFTTPHQGWDEIARIHPSVLKLFVLVVAPMSLIPPLMLEYAGRHYGAVLFPGALPQAWSIAAVFFLITELLTVPLMGWGIKAIANGRGIPCDYHDAFTLAAIAPVPLWLSALVLFSSQPILILAVLALGLAGSVLLIFRGVGGILKVEEDLVAFDVAYVVTALGLIAWVLLVMLGLVPAVT
jgi:Yip1 domain